MFHREEHLSLRRVAVQDAEWEFEVIFVFRNAGTCAGVGLYAILTLAGADAQAGGEFGQGEAKALQCVSCHGDRGLTPNPMFPHLAGQNASYLEIQLEQFKTGERFHPVMSPIAESLSRQDIEDLAVYYSRIEVIADER